MLYGGILKMLAYVKTDRLADFVRYKLAKVQVIFSKI